MPGQFNRTGRKTCSRCRVEKPFEDFTPFNRRPPDTAAGRKSICKPCRAQEMREYNQRPDVRPKNVANHRRWRQRKPALAMWSKARTRAQQRGMQFTITPADLGPLPIKCPVLGIALDYAVVGRVRANSPSVDRIDNSLGYVPGNVRVISHRANILKRDATLDELRALVAYCERNTLKDLI